MKYKTYKNREYRAHMARVHDNHLVYSDHISEFHPKKNYKSSGPCAALLPALKELPLKSLGPRTLTLTTESNRSSSAVSAHDTTERVSASVAAKKEIWLTHVFIGQETGPGSNSRNTDGQNWKVLQSSASSLIYTLNYAFLKYLTLFHSFKLGISTSPIHW